MFKRFVFVVFVLVGLAGLANADTRFHWTFDGTEGQEFISDTDIVSGYVAAKFYDATYGENEAQDINYAETNPWYNAAGTSLEYFNDPGDNDPGVGVRVEDPGVNSPLDLSDVTACTIEAFVYPGALRQAVIVRKYIDGYYYIDTRGTGNFAVRLAGGGEDLGDGGGICNDLTYEADNWYHVALVWDGTEIRFYVNGQQSQDFGPDSGSSIPYTGGIDDSARALGIGCIIRDNDDPPSSSGQFFFGKIDEVRISDAALPVSSFLLYSKSGSASRPSPKNGQTNVCDGISLCWTAGADAA